MLNIKDNYAKLVTAYPRDKQINIVMVSCTNIPKVFFLSGTKIKLNRQYNPIHIKTIQFHLFGWYFHHHFGESLNSSSAVSIILFFFLFVGKFEFKWAVFCFHLFGLLFDLVSYKQKTSNGIYCSSEDSIQFIFHFYYSNVCWQIGTLFSSLQFTGLTMSNELWKCWKTHRECFGKKERIF